MIRMLFTGLALVAGMHSAGADGFERPAAVEDLLPSPDTVAGADRVLEPLSAVPGDIPGCVDGWPVNHKLVYRLYKEMGLTVRSKYRRKIASRGREVVSIAAAAANERLSMDFVTDRFENGRYFRILTLMDTHTRECLALEPAVSMTGRKVADCLDLVAARRGCCPQRSRWTTGRSSSRGRWTPGHTRTECVWTSSGPAGRWRTG